MPKEYIHTDEFLTLGPDQRRSVYFALCEPALAVWHSYAQRRGEMAYVESVIGPRPPEPTWMWSISAIGVISAALPVKKTSSAM